MAIIARIAHTVSTPSALRTCAVLFLLSVCVPGSLFAQSRGVVTEVAPIYLRPDESRTPLRTAAVGTALVVLQTEGEWLQVEFEDPQFGRRVGWTRKTRVRVEAPHTTPMDLSVAPDSPAPPRRPTDAPEDDTRADRADREQRPRRDGRRIERGWLDVNFGVAKSGADLSTYAFAGILHGEPSAIAAAYPEPSTGASFDVGGGVMFNRWIGAGVSIAGTAHEDIVGLGATIPHPYFFNAEVIASGATDDKLMRTEGSVHLQAMVAAYQGPRGRFRVFGGPTYFRYEADMVQDVEYTQIATRLSRAQSVTITGYEAVTTEGTGWGWHVGADGSVFFNRVVGIGGFARFSRGTVEIDEPMSELLQDVTVGGLQVGGGLRLRF